MPESPKRPIGRHEGHRLTPPSPGGLRPGPSRRQEGVVSPRREVAKESSDPVRQERSKTEGTQAHHSDAASFSAEDKAGIGLRWKMVAATASITLVSAVLIFIAVYSTAVRSLNDEIDAKGVRLVKLMGSIDSRIWFHTMYHRDPRKRYRVLTRLYQQAFGRTDKIEEAAKDKPELFALVEQITNKPSSVQGPLIDDLFTKLSGGEEWRRTVQNDEEWHRARAQLLSPFGDVEVLKPLKREGGGSSDILNAIVSDMTQGEGQGLSIEAVDSEGGLSLTAAAPGTTRDLEGVKVWDATVKQTGVSVRSFRLEQASPSGTLWFVVLLSLEQIEQAKVSLRQSIILPIVAAVLVAIGIAVWVSSFITRPLKTLMRDIQIVSEGDLDHETAAESRDEIGLLARTFNKMTRALKTAHEQELHQKAVEHELSIATEIQSNLVPKTMPRFPGYDVSAFYRPSREVGGDYYDFIEIDDHHTGIIVADVSGKGVPGALVMAMARAFIRMEAERTRNASTADTLLRANRMLAQDIRKGMFVTALYCILDKETHELLVSSAGHNPLILWRAATNQIELVNPSGIALGFDKGPVFERTIREEKIVIDRGDRLMLYTDGVIDVMNEGRVEFGDQRVFDLVTQLAVRDSNQFLNRMVKTLDDYKGAAPQHDDMTIVTARRVG